VTVADAGGGVLVTVNSGRAVSGSLTVADGAQRALVITLLDRTGGAGVTGPGDQIRVVVTNTVVASFTPTQRTGAILRGTLNGNDPGATTLRIQYLQAGRVVYETPSIGVGVT
jgi:hypothetical protein